MPITDPTSRQFEDLADLQLTLMNEGCIACDLGFQEGLNGCCVSRGNPLKRRMIIGQNPGKWEDAQSVPFCGPAGVLLQKILASVGWDIDQDWYITNIVLCRFIAPKGSSKENLTPYMEQRKKCRPYLDAQIEFIQPRIIVTLGKPATEAILGLKNIRMGDYRGQIVENLVVIEKTEGEENITVGRPFVFPCLHPAALLHTQSQPERHELYRQQMWQDIQYLKKFVEENNL